MNKFIDSIYFLYGMISFSIFLGTFLFVLCMFTLNENRKLKRNLNYCEMFSKANYEMGATDYSLYLNEKYEKFNFSLQDFKDVNDFLEGQKGSTSEQH